IVFARKIRSFLCTKESLLTTHIKSFTIQPFLKLLFDNLKIFLIIHS
ncbi:hypothetical protein X975_11126, partial [Stegodyphus mimosarum]